MQLFFDFVMKSAGYFITTYFIYSLLGRRKNIGIALLAVLFVTAVIPYLAGPQSIGWQAYILLLVYNVGPIFFAALIFFSITGGIPIIKLKKHRSLKNLKSYILTKKFNLRNSLLIMTSSLVVGITSWLIFEGMMVYLLVLLSMFGFIFSIIWFFIIQNVKQERVILFVGKQKEKSYVYDIPKQQLKVELTDFFNNDRYIVDRIGEISVIDGKTIQKDYLYWIATSDQVDIQSPLTEVTSLKYQHDLGRFEKYHLKHVDYRLLNEELIFIKEKVIK